MVLQLMVLRDLYSYIQNNEIQLPTYTIDKSKLKVDKRLKYKLQKYENPEENIDREISDIAHSNIFTNMSPRAKDIQERINKWEFSK